MLLALAAASIVSGPAPPTDARAAALLESARAFVASRTYPPELSYRVEISLTSDDGVAGSRVYDGAFDGSRDELYAHSISEEEARAGPVTPHGTTYLIGFSASTATGSTGTAIPLNEPEFECDVMGVPLLTPTYAFGLGRQMVQDPLLPAGMRIIGRTRTSARDYDASYLGSESVDGETCSHLRLVPTRDPERLRLRELWIAPDGAPLRAVTHGNFTSRPWDGLDWTIAFERAGSALFLSSEVARESVRIDKHRSGRVAVRFRDIAVANVHAAFPLSIEPNEALREPDGRATPGPNPRDFDGP